MTEEKFDKEKFKKFQNKIQLAMGIIFLMKEEEFFMKNIPTTDKICNEYCGKAIKRIENDTNFARSIVTGTKIIANLARDTFIEE